MSLVVSKKKHRPSMIFLVAMLLGVSLAVAEDASAYATCATDSVSTTTVAFDSPVKELQWIGTSYSTVAVVTVSGGFCASAQERSHQLSALTSIPSISLSSFFFFFLSFFL
jgi:hypothetical protein